MNDTSKRAYDWLKRAASLILRVLKTIFGFGSQASPPARAAGWLWRFFVLGVFAVAFYFFAVDINLLYLFGSSPSLKSLEKPKMQLATEIFTADGKLIGRFFKENRFPVEYQYISPNVVRALLATEDIRYYDHAGVDPTATLAVLYSAAIGNNRGGSTITQQLAKNLYKTRRADADGLLSNVGILRTIIAKSKEWITAIKLERAYTKEEILTMYLNTVDFGSNYFGIKTAARNYFDTSADSLLVEEAAVLVGMLKATTTYNPRKNYKNSITRRNVVLEQMQKNHFLSIRQADSLQKLPITLHLRPTERADGVSDYYNGYLTQYLEDWADKSNRDIYTDGLKIYLTIDSRMQNHARSAMQTHVKDLQGRFGRHWGKRNPWVDENNNELPDFLDNQIKRTSAYKQLAIRFADQPDSIQTYLNRKRKMVVFNWKYPQGDTVQMSVIDSLKYYKKLLHAGLITIDPFTGQIKAWIGGLDYKFFKYDHVWQSRRQPGSTFKAFVYAAAIAQGYSPCFKIQDKRFKVNYNEMENGAVKQTEWAPVNAANTFSGMNMTIRHAMGRSINSVAAQLTELLGKNTDASLKDRWKQRLLDYGFVEPFPDAIYGACVVAEMAHKMGIASNLKPVPSIGLGSNDVSLYEMGGAYATFINQGNHNRPQLVQRIEDHGGNVVYQHVPLNQRALSTESAFLMVHMLKGTLQEPMGTAQALWGFKITRGNDLAGKTGTSSNQSDGWFMGLTKNLVTGVWVGAEERSVHFRTLKTGEGSKTALPIYGKFMEKVYADQSLGINEGYFAKATVKITRKYNCPTYYPRAVVVIDTMAKRRADSVAAASAPAPLQE